MHIYSDMALAGNLVGTMRLKQAFMEVEREKTILRRAFWFSGAAGFLCGLMLLHHSLDIPALNSVWAQIVLLCS